MTTLEHQPEGHRGPSNPVGTWSFFLLLMAILLFLQYTPASMLAMENPLTGESSSRALAQNISGGDSARQFTILLLGLAGGFSLLWRERRAFGVQGILGWSILVYVGWVFLSLVWADDPWLTLKRVVIFAILAFGALGVVNRATLEQIVWVVFWSSLLYLLVGLGSEIMHGTFDPFGAHYRFAGMFHPNYQGLNCSLLILSALCLASMGHSKSILAAIVCLGLAFLLLTKSRTALGSLVVALLVFGWLVWSFERKLLLLIAGGWVGSLLFFLYQDLILARFWKIFLLGRDISHLKTLTGRVPLWEAALDYVFARPLTGYGYQGFWTSDHTGQIASRIGWAPYAGHSTYIDLLLGLGLFGLLVFLLVYALGIRRARKNFRQTGNVIYAFMAAVLCFALMHGLLETMLLTANWLSFLCLTVLVILGFQEPEPALSPGGKVPFPDVNQPVLRKQRAPYSRDYGYQRHRHHI